MSNKIKILTSFSIIMAIMLFSGCLKDNSNSYKVDLEIWGAFDDSNNYRNIINEYKAINPFIGNIKYRKLGQEDYEDDLLSALATGEGPDIFLINNYWFQKFKDKIEPAPEILVGEQEFRSNFVDVVSDNFLSDGKIYSTPLSVDSLVLFYNKDLFNAEGIISPPETWEDLKESAKKVTKVDGFGNISQSGVALGTAYNINRSSDILELIMLQKGTQMNSRNGERASFSQSADKYGNSTNPGQASMDFYVQFANSNSPFYSWNPRLHYSLDAFSEGKIAMMLNYSWHIDTIRNKNSKLNFAVAKVPQFEGSIPVNVANYNSFVVSKNKNVPKGSTYNNELRVFEAWQFLKFLTMKNEGTINLYNGISKNSKEFSVSIDPASVYLEDKGVPAARRDIIEKQKDDTFIGPFAFGNLIAKGWNNPYREEVDLIFAEAIDSVNNGNSTSRDAIETASNRVNQLFK